MALQRPDPDEYVRPSAFEEARQAFAGEDVAEMLGRLEAQVATCPRLALAACIHGFLSLAPEAQEAAVRRFLASRTSGSAAPVQGCAPGHTRPAGLPADGRGRQNGSPRSRLRGENLRFDQMPVSRRRRKSGSS